MGNHFGSDLSWSHRQASRPYWEQVYRQAFHDFQGMNYVAQSDWAQPAGIDRQVFTKTGRVYTVDEKARRRYYECSAENKRKYFAHKSTKYYPDILIEFLSDADRRAPGWAVKDLACDFFNYSIVPIGQAFLLPVSALQGAWRKCGELWIKEFGELAALNSYNGRKWRTLNCPVPVPVLMRAMTEAMFFHFTPEVEGGELCESPEALPPTLPPVQSVNADAIPW